jgi:deoxyribonuclease V
MGRRRGFAGTFTETHVRGADDVEHGLKKRADLAHSWSPPRAKASAIQLALASEVVLRPFAGCDAPDVLAAGVDVAYSLDGARSWAAAVVMDKQWHVRDSVIVPGEPDMPYVRGYLGFREGRLTVEALEALEIVPALVFCDGHGVVHERGLGLASHVGVLLDVPTIGVPKTPFHSIDHMPGPERGDFYVLTKEWGAQGVAIRLKSGSKPVYVSPGHLTDLSSSIACALAFSSGRHRVPEPLAAAHTASVRARSDDVGRV